MRWTWLVLVLAVGCKKTNKPAEGSGSAEPAPAPTVKAPPVEEPSAEASPTQAPPPPGQVDLLQNAPSIVRVSSRVTGPEVQPDALVDGNLHTAWHSRSGDLQGAWIDIT